ncbi:MAG TPA: hypothetical protein VFE47_19680 [Tepidisphaeraceae bacterium]|jgi:hypothetical protein|nr:hypothetical protein [Tepidisphaeraceae bacterium]
MGREESRGYHSSMRRRLFTALSLLSLALSVTLCVKWIRSNNPKLTLRESYWFTVAGYRVYSHRGHIYGGRVLVVTYINQDSYEATLLTSAQKKKKMEEEVLVETPSIPWITTRVLTYLRPNRIGLARRHGSIGEVSSLGGPPLVMSTLEWTAWAIPYWLPVLTTGLLPAFMLLQRLRTRRRSRTGHCPTCGYDLRATPGRCPECGTVAQIRMTKPQANDE